MPELGYERTLHANETAGQAQAAVRQALVATRRVLEDKPHHSGHPWAGKRVRFIGAPELVTTTQPDGRTVVTGSWAYEVL